MSYRNYEKRSASFKVVLEMLRNYPIRSTAIISFLLLAGLSEGFGVAAVLPTISFILNDATTADTRLGEIVGAVLNSIGLPSTISVLLTLVVLSFILKAGLILAATTQVGFATAQFSTELRVAMVRALVAARWRLFTDQATGGVANSLGIEASHAGAIFTGTCTVIAHCIQVIVYSCLALLVSWKITVASLLAGVLVMVVLGRLIEMSRRAAHQQRDSYEGLAARLVDGIQGIKPLKAMAQEHRLQPLLEQDITALNLATRRLILGGQALMVLKEPLMVILLAIGIYAVVSLTDTQFEALVVMALLFNRTVTYIAMVQSQYQAIISVEPFYLSIKRKTEEIDAEQEIFNGTTHISLRNFVSFKDVYCSLGSTQVLNGASFSIPANSISVIVGPSGAGKTTVTDLITGLCQPDSGQILIDHVSLSDIDISVWRAQLGYVPQETFLFHDSIHNNVTLHEETYGAEDVNEALRAAGAWSFVSRMPEGIDTIVGERGSKLSGGQRQRISIARAIIRNPRLLILDEPTAALDPVTETEICETLTELGRRMAILVVSHQPAMVSIGDNVFRLIDGKLHRAEKRT